MVRYPCVALAGCRLASALGSLTRRGYYPAPPILAESEVAYHTESAVLAHAKIAYQVSDGNWSPQTRMV